MYEYMRFLLYIKKGGSHINYVFSKDLFPDAIESLAIFVINRSRSLVEVLING